MTDLRQLRVRPGDPVLPAWNRLLDWAKQFRLVAGRGVRFQRTPNGTYVVADLRSNPWNHPFKVSLSDQEAAIAFGTVEDIVPRISGKSIDGLDEKGRQGVPPKLRLDGGPNSDLRSWVAVEARVDRDSGKIEPNSKDAVAIRHVRDLRASEAEVGRHPLAMLLWAADGKSVLRARQITHFNLRHFYAVEPGAKNRPGRHLFWAT